MRKNTKKEKKRESFEGEKEGTSLIACSGSAGGGGGGVDLSWLYKDAPSPTTLYRVWGFLTKKRS